MTAEDAIRRQGPCAFCGGPYAAHRMVDTQMERVQAGEDIGEVAGDYDETVEQMVGRWAALITVLLDDRENADDPQVVA